MTASIGPVQQAIFARRSIRRFADRRVERQVLERLLDAATQAPNHRLTRPWRFFVLDRPGAMRDRLAELAEEVAWRGMPEPRDDAARTRAHAKAEEIASVPALIVAYSTPGRNSEESRENYAAVACALQNVQLAAVEEGLVSGWSTGGITRAPELRELLGAESDWDLVGYVAGADIEAIEAEVVGRDSDIDIDVRIGHALRQLRGGRSQLHVDAVGAHWSLLGRVTNRCPRV